MGIWMLVLRTTKTKNDKELWFIVNGVPIRYSLREMTLISGLHCHDYPNNYDRMGGSGFIEKHFESGKKIKYETVEKRLKAMKGPCSGERLKMAVLETVEEVVGEPFGEQPDGEADGQPDAEAVGQPYG
ncbi:hypothetical protein Bca52824_064911 [Brassica carinata]|uniref:DUF1985 domain-containing protein n=1 Tax=Brassica carinata TaxID=52824 RepID=A0A8X7QH93_BRACI|nr:hypothetical protein Bca52824_064911 [Brassica carinata]